MARARTGQYDLRVTILPCVYAAPGGNNESAPSWPGPGRDYSASRDTITAGEDIAQGIRQSTGGMRVRIKGGRIAVNAADRVRNKVTGELWEVVGVARERGETVLTLERARSQEAGQ